MTAHDGAPRPDCLRDTDNSRQILGGIGKTTLYELIAEGELNTVKIGRRRFVVDSSITSYIER